MGESYRINMLPLSIVLVPHQPVLLQLVEKRFRELAPTLGECGIVGTCFVQQTASDSTPEALAATGMILKVELAQSLGDDSTMVAVRGVRRVRIDEWNHEGEIPEALVTDLDDEQAPDPEILKATQSAVRALQNLVSEIDVDRSQFNCSFDEDPVIAAWQCCAFAEMSQRDRQDVISTQDVNDRLRLVMEICCERYGDWQRRIASDED